MYIHMYYECMLKHVHTHMHMYPCICICVSFCVYVMHVKLLNVCSISSNTQIIYVHIYV